MTTKFKSSDQRLAAVCLLMVVVFVSASPASIAQDQLSGQALVDALRSGGFVIYFRHADTDWSQNDNVTADGDWKSCDPSRMRQLSDPGRSVARGIGEAIGRLAIPVGRVLSSEYCRAKETAQLMNLGPVTPTRSIMNMLAAEWVGGAEAAAERARQELGRPPKPGTNTIIVAHGNLMRAASGAYAGEAGSGVFKPLGDNKFTLVAMLEPQSWSQLAEQFAQP